MAWKRELTLAALNASSENTMVAHLDIVYTRLEEALLEAEMPVDARRMPTAASWPPESELGNCGV